MEKSVQEDVLKWMLGQAFRAEDHKRRLDERLKRINAERNAPIGGIGYEPIIKRKEPGEGAASIVFQLADIEERIYKQKSELEKAIVRVMTIIEYIPITEIDREIFEMRHIDMMQWPDIEAAIPMSKSQCIRRYNATIDRLLLNPRIQKMVNSNEKDYLLWCMEHDRGKPKKQSGGIKPGNKTGNLNQKKTRKNKRGQGKES